MSIEYTSEKCYDYTWFAKWCISGDRFGDTAIEYGNDIVICRYREGSDKAILIVLGLSGFVFHPRTGSFATLPIYTLDGDIMPARGVLGGGWYPDGSIPVTQSFSDPLNNQYTLNTSTGSVLLGSDGTPMEFR